MKITKATVVKANKGYTKATSESYKDFKVRKPGYSMDKKTVTVKYPKCK
mgnify:CR=1 FL=1